MECITALMECTGDAKAKQYICESLEGLVHTLPQPFIDGMHSAAEQACFKH